MNSSSQVVFGLLASLFFVAGCNRQEPAAKALPTNPPAAAQRVDSRDQYALAQAIEAAQALPAKDQARAYADLRNAWQGERYQWEARFQPVLCADAAHCRLVPFDGARDESEPRIQGWLPRLTLDDAGFAALRDVCKSHAACVVRFEGRLARLVVSPENPTNVGFDQVRILAARDETSGELWGRKKSRN